MPAEARIASANRCRHWPHDVKLAVALVIAATVGLLSAEAWPATACLGVFSLALHAWAGTPGRLLLRRVLQFLPFVALLSAGAIMSRPSADAAVWSAALVLRCLVAFLTGLWLMQVLTASEFFDTLARWRMPAVLTLLLSFLLRYVALLWEEHERLLRAQRSRAGGPCGRRQEWTAAIERVGLLVLRALDRAERVHRAMLARGWSGVSAQGGDAQ